MKSLNTLMNFDLICLVHRRGRRLRVLDPPPGFDFLEAGSGAADRFLDAAGAGAGAGAAAAAGTDARLADFGFAADALGAGAEATGAEATGAEATGAELRNNNSCLRSN